MDTWLKINLLAAGAINAETEYRKFMRMHEKRRSRHDMLNEFFKIYI